MIATIYQFVAYMEKHFSKRTAFQYVQGETVHSVCYAQYIADVKRFAVHLKRMFSDMEGKHVGILSGNSYSYMVCFLGVLLAKGVAVLLNPEESVENLQYQIDFSDLTCLFTGEAYQIREAFFALHLEGTIKTIEQEVKNSGIYKELEDEHADGFTGQSVSPVFLEDMTDAERKKMAVLLFTSGTTGTSKGVMLSAENLFALREYAVGQCEAAGDWMELSVLRALMIAPMYHISGVASLLTWLAMGSWINLCTSFKYLYRDMRKMESDYTGSVPPMILKAWYKDLKKGKRERLGGLKTISCGAAPIDSDLFAEFEKNGITVVQGYGLTELFGGGTMNSSQDPAKIRSVGRPGAGCEMKIEEGEVCFKSKAVMLGYYKDEEATKKVLRDGWLHTGDFGHLDEDGYLYLTGRKKNLIILSSGENVSPEELELLLQRNPLIEEVQIKEKNEKICAEIFCPSGEQEAIRRYVAEVNREIASYKRIALVEFRDQAFPRTSLGKIRRG